MVGARLRAWEVLEGVGDSALGEWEESGDVAYHVRRRLTLEEQSTIGEACDIRGMDEAQDRFHKAWRWLHPQLRQIARAEIEKPHQ